MGWILSKINIEFIIQRLRWEERPELPEALREAVVNDLTHLDYHSTAYVQIYLFADRLEIVSPGGLPAGITESELGTRSVPRNPLLFGMLHRMDTVEHIGSGIRRIRDLCREHGVSEPVFEATEHWVMVTFKRPNANAAHQVGGLSGDQVDIIRNCLATSAIGELTQVTGRSNRTKFRDQVLKPLMEHGWLTVPPNSAVASSGIV